VRGDADIRRVLAALAARGPARGEWLELFRLAAQVSGEGELKRLLPELAPSVPADVRVQTAYAEAARRLDPADRRGALVALAAAGRLDARMQATVLRMTDELAAVAERQQMLEQLAPYLLPDAAVAAAFAAAASGLPDDSARRAMDAYARATGADRPGRDTIPQDQVDRRDATTSLVHQDRTDGGAETERVLLARGVTLAADRARFTLSRDGFLIFRENLPGGRVRRVEIRPGAGDALHYTWNGDFGGIDREEWMRGMTDHFARSTRPQLRW
jgi:hypothetical protein